MQFMFGICRGWSGTLLFLFSTSHTKLLLCAFYTNTAWVFELFAQSIRINILYIFLTDHSELLFVSLLWTDVAVAASRRLITFFVKLIDSTKVSILTPTWTHVCRFQCPTAILFAQHILVIVCCFGQWRFKLISSNNLGFHNIKALIHFISHFILSGSNLLLLIICCFYLLC
jgi:hypothetical protein